jgi:hypothetical protein
MSPIPAPKPASTAAPTNAEAPAPLAVLARLVVKDGVSLGLLPEAERQLALAWVWAGLPQGEVLNEAGINAALKAQLAGPALWLRTDHVELRRWLVDAGWLQRDGYGREYRRAPAPERHAALAATVQGTDTQTWAAERRAAHEAERSARRERWARQQAPQASA